MARSHNQEPTSTPEPDVAPIGPLAFVWRDTGESYSFFDLPRSSQERIVQYGVNQLQDDKAAGATAKAKTHLTPEGGKTVDIKSDAVKTWRQADPANDALFESWRSAFMAEVRDAAIAGELEAVKVSESQESKDRHEAAERLLIELYARIDDKAGRPRRVVFKPTQGPKKAINEANRAYNEGQISQLLDPDGQWMTRFAPDFERHLAAVRAERQAALESAKVKPAPVYVESLSELDSLAEAAE